MSGDENFNTEIFYGLTTSATKKIDKISSFLTTLTSTPTQTIFVENNTALTNTSSTPQVSDAGDTFAYVVVAMIVAFIMIAYGIKQRQSKTEDVDNLIPPGGNDSEYEDDFLTLGDHAAKRLERPHRTKV